MATTRAPPAFASSGIISGTGLAMANTIESGAMVEIMADVAIPGADTPTKISLSLIIVSSGPRSWRGLVTAAISCWAGFIKNSPGASAPHLSVITMSRKP